MKSLIEQGRYAEAFDLGLRNDRMAGDPEYDYFFGIAAVDSGRASLGVLALERVLLDNPGNDLARLELARGYFVVGDYERAREEFQHMRTKQLPVSVRNSVDRYLNAIRAADPQFRTVQRTFAEYAVGYNSNVNFATSAGTIDIPSIGPITLDRNSTPSPSALAQVAVGTQIQGPLRPDLKYMIGLEANHRGHAQRDNFDQGSYTAMGGLDLSWGGASVKASGFFSRSLLDYVRFRDTAGVVFDWSQPVDRENLVRASVSYSELRYGPSNVARDANLTSYTAAWNHYLGGAWKSSMDLEATLSSEDNIRGRGDFQRGIAGVRSGVQFYPGGRWQGNIGFGYAASTYKDPDPLFQRRRADTLITLEAGLQYQLTQGWSTRVELLNLNNQSNITLYAYDSVVVLMKMRYEWK